MNKLETAAEQYVENIPDNGNSFSDIEEAFIAGANWQVIETSRIIERAIIKHNHSTEETVLKNYSKTCGCLNKGRCTVNNEKCAFSNCDYLKELFKD